MSCRQLCRIYNDAAVSSKLIKGIFCYPSVQNDLRFIPSRSAKIATQEL